MRRKIQVLLNKETYIIWEPTVSLYWLSLEDPEQFIIDLFTEFNDKVPKITNIELANLLQELFEIEDSTIEKILQNKIPNTPVEKKKINNFHIVIWQFMKFYWNWFEDTMKIPFKIFQKMIKDIKIVSWEQDIKDLEEDSQTPDKQKLKNLLSKFS